ncbi:MAG: phenylalanine--tRNA ligase subunit beta [Verrucomicrobiota bacterium]
MKTSLNWLQNYIEIDCSAEELAERLTMAGLEVEEIVAAGKIPEGVVAAEIRGRDKHPNADRLSVCEVDAGTGETLQVVCGAPNCEPGTKVPLATVGTVLAEDFKVKKAKLRGVESYGMLCSANELGVSDDQSGLMELPADVKPGTPLQELIEEDTVIDWEITPNRPDWLSHIGIAREFAAVADKRLLLRLPELSDTIRKSNETEDETRASVEVEESELCPRYVARLIEDVKIKPSPDWMQKALSAVGIRPINNVVDITNYVLMECGQPLHAFDYDKVADHRLIVRRAGEKEKMTTLDGASHELHEEDLVIADPDKPLALAGIMGGQTSEIGEDTTTVLLESAAFDPATVRSTSRRLGLTSESSYRFERGVDVEMVKFASDRAADLLIELADGKVKFNAIDVYARPYHPPEVSCRLAKCNTLLGVELTTEELADIFERLGLAITDQAETEITVAVPPYRSDLTREADLIEEVARIYGLNKIPFLPAKASTVAPFKADQFAPLQETRREMLGLGLTESMNYSLLSVAKATAYTGVSEEELVKLLNPISAASACMRPSLLPSLINTVANNIASGNYDLAMFEIGRVFRKSADFPEERYQLGLLFTGRKHPERFGKEQAEEYDFFDLKGCLEGWFDYKRIGNTVWRVAEIEGFVNGQTAEVVSETGVRLAACGKVAPDMVEGIRLMSPLYLGLVELDQVFNVGSEERKFTPLPQYPATRRDISLVASPSIEHRQIVEVIEQAREPWLVDVSLSDVYEDEETLGAGRRSLTYTLTYRNDERTLKDEEVNEVHEKTRKRLQDNLSVTLR